MPGRQRGGGGPPLDTGPSRAQNHGRREVMASPPRRGVDPAPAEKPRRVRCEPCMETRCERRTAGRDLTTHRDPRNDIQGLVWRETDNQQPRCPASLGSLVRVTSQLRGYAEREKDTVMALNRDMGPALLIGIVMTAVLPSMVGCRDFFCLNGPIPIRGTDLCR